MAWKRLRPPALCTVGKSMCIGALISLLAATFLGTIHTVISCVRFKSLTLSCYNHSDNSLSTQMQWEITISGMICSGFFLYLAFYYFDFSYSSISIVWSKKILVSNFFSLLLFTCTLSRFSSSLNFIGSCEHFQLFSTVSTTCNIYQLRFLGTVRGDQSFLPTLKNNKKTFLVPSTDGTCLFYFPTGTNFLLFSLSILRRKQSQIFIRSFCAYHWSRFEDVLSHLCSAVI